LNCLPSGWRFMSYRLCRNSQLAATEYAHLRAGGFLLVSTKYAVFIGVVDKNS